METDKRIHKTDEEVHDHRRFGWWFSADTELVYNPQTDSGGPLIVMEDGEIEDRYLQRAQRKIGEGRGMLWGRLGPVKIDGIEIRKNARIWHHEREAWLRAVEIDVTEDPEPIIRFKIDGTSPVEFVRYYGSQLEELREEGVIESQKEVNDRAEQALESFRESRDS